MTATASNWPSWPSARKSCSTSLKMTRCLARRSAHACARSRSNVRPPSKGSPRPVTSSGLARRCSVAISGSSKTRTAPTPPPRTRRGETSISPASASCGSMRTASPATRRPRSSTNCTRLLLPTAIPAPLARWSPSRTSSDKRKTPQTRPSRDVDRNPETFLLEDLFRAGSNKNVLVREAGLEPAHPRAPEPKSGASANSATRARAPL